MAHIDGQTYFGGAGTPVHPRRHPALLQERLTPKNLHFLTYASIDADRTIVATGVTTCIDEEHGTNVTVQNFGYTMPWPHATLMVGIAAAAARSWPLIRTATRVGPVAADVVEVDLEDGPDHDKHRPARWRLHICSGRISGVGAINDIHIAHGRRPRHDQQRPGRVSPASLPTTESAGAVTATLSGAANRWTWSP